MMDIGLNPSHVLTLAKLPADLFSRDNAKLTAAEYFRLWSGLEEAAGSDELPLKLGQAISVEVFDPPIFASFCSPNLNVALKRLATFKPLIGPLILDVDIQSKKTKVSLSCYGYEDKIPRSLGAAEVVFFTQLARLATRKTINPIEVVLTDLPNNIESYKTYLGCDIRQGKSNHVAFSAEDANYPFLTEDVAMWEFFEGKLNRRLADIQAEASISEKVKSLLLEMLPSGESSIEEVADRLAMSKRSLQRHLKQDNTNYQEVLNTTRKELADHYLLRSTISSGEISFLLGFQDSNSFLRAFKSWTGTSPVEYRLENASEQQSRSH